MEQDEMVESKSVRESVNICSSTLRLRTSPKVCAIENPTSKALTVAYNFAASTERVARLHFADDQVITEQL